MESSQVSHIYAYAYCMLYAGEQCHSTPPSRVGHFIDLEGLS